MGIFQWRVWDVEIEKDYGRGHCQRGANIFEKIMGQNMGKALVYLGLPVPSHGSALRR